MAGVTRVALVYSNSPRFWWPLDESNGGLRPGPDRPAFKVYDGSPEDGSISVLTFFTLASLSDGANADADAGDNDDATLARHCAEQMTTSLSPTTVRDNPGIIQNIKDYDDFHVKRWPQEKYISEDSNPRRINPHPEPNPELAKSEWDGMLLFAATETDQRSPGVMEGAIGAALRVMDELKKSLSS